MAGLSTQKLQSLISLAQQPLSLVLVTELAVLLATHPISPDPATIPTIINSNFRPLIFQSSHLSRFYYLRCHLRRLILVVISYFGRILVHFGLEIGVEPEPEMEMEPKLMSKQLVTVQLRHYLQNEDVNPK